MPEAQISIIDTKGSETCFVSLFKIDGVLILRFYRSVTPLPTRDGAHGIIIGICMFKKQVYAS